jgi:hypothetical protein
LVAGRNHCVAPGGVDLRSTYNGRECPRQKARQVVIVLCTGNARSVDRLFKSYALRLRCNDVFAGTHGSDRFCRRRLFPLVDCRDGLFSQLSLRAWPVSSSKLSYCQAIGLLDAVVADLILVDAILPNHVSLLVACALAKREEAERVLSLMWGETWVVS